MTYGRTVCDKLKEIRLDIANKNDILLETSECHFDGECQGTCPKCEAEVRLLENELLKRKHLGKVATIAGISFGIASTFSACAKTPPEGDPVPDPLGEITPVECVQANNSSDDNTIVLEDIELQDTLP